MRDIKKTADDINKHADEFQAIDITSTMHLQEMVRKMTGIDEVNSTLKEEDVLFEKIAKEEMFIESLDPNQKDFHQVHVSCIQEALRKAYEAGINNSSKH
jgi:hypothetical protein